MKKHTAGAVIWSVRLLGLTTGGILTHDSFSLPFPSLFPPSLPSPLQMAFPNLRSDNNLIAFNRRLEECNWDLRKWRASELSKRASGQIPRDLEEGFEVLDLDNGTGWDLVCKVGLGV